MNVFETKTIVEERTEAYHMGQWDERQKIIKVIEDFKDDVELSGSEDNVADMAYVGACLNILEKIKGEKKP